MPSVQLLWDVLGVGSMGPQPSPPPDRQMATEHWLQESTTKIVLKPIVKNDQPFYTKTTATICVKRRCRCVQGKYHHPLPSPHIFLLLPKTWSTNDLCPCCWRETGIHNIQAHDLYFLSTTSEYSEDMTHTSQFWKHTCMLLASIFTDAQEYSSSISYVQTIRH